ncbi:MAG: hypothetical protein ABI980_13965 [Nitrospirota bacterium]
MNTIRKEVRELISVHEKIQSAMAEGSQLTDDEKGLIEMCANELIISVSEQQNPPPQERRSRESSDGARF